MSVAHAGQLLPHCGMDKVDTQVQRDEETRAHEQADAFRCFQKAAQCLCRVASSGESASARRSVHYGSSDVKELLDALRASAAAQTPEAAASKKTSSTACESVQQVEWCRTCLRITCICPSKHADDADWTQQVQIELPAEAAVLDSCPQESLAETIPVHVSAMSGEEYVFEVEHTSTAHDLKLQIANRLGLEVQAANLIAGAEHLPDDAVLGDYAELQVSTLTVSVKLSLYIRPPPEPETKPIRYCCDCGRRSGRCHDNCGIIMSPSDGERYEYPQYCAFCGTSLCDRRIKAQCDSCRQK